MELTIRIDLDNAAFEESSGSEVSRILRRLCSVWDEADMEPGEIRLRDHNGNVCGSATVAAFED